MGEYMLTSLAGLTSLLLLSRAEILQTFLQLLADLSRDLLAPRVSPRKIFGRPFSTLNPKRACKNASLDCMYDRKKLYIYKKHLKFPIFGT